MDNDRLVVFSGTPCQISGLYGFLGSHKYDNLVTVDLVCHGTPSPRLLRKYFAYHASVFGSKVIDYRSRDKYYGYDFSTATILFADKNKVYHKGKESDMMLRLYFKNLCSRPSCYKCHFKTLNRASDITIFDCWDAQSVSSKFSDYGATNVFIHTGKGQSVFEVIKEYFVWMPSDIEPVIQRDGVMIKNFVSINPRREEFFKDLNEMDIESIEYKYLDHSIRWKLTCFLKPYLYKIGLFRWYLSIKKLLIK